MVSCEGQVEPLESGLEYTVAGRGPRELTVLVKTAQIYSQLKVGNVFVLAGGAVSWLSKKQTVVALSTAEAEYIALSTAAQEAAWFQKFLNDLQVPSKPITIMEDHQGAIALARNPTDHPRTKHIDIRFHFDRKAYEEGIIDIT